MSSFAVYREVRRQQRSHEWSRPQPTRVTTVTAETIEEAVQAFIESLPAGGGWREPVIEITGSRRRGHANLWLRRYTPSGRYKGETHFLLWKEEQRDAQ